MQKDNLEPTVVTPLSRQHRQSLFLLLLFVFLVAVPLFVFYSSGYRYDFFAKDGGVVATGGLYISVFGEAGDIYLNEEPVKGSRIFRKATYVQSVAPGLHNIHVQASGLHTWVKSLPVFPHIVTEAEAILLPQIPQVRLITSLQLNGTNVLSVGSTASSTLPGLVLSNTYLISTSSATSTLTNYSDNPEYLYLVNLFTPATTSATTTATSTRKFQFVDESVESLVLATSSPIITKSRGSIEIFEREGSLFARYATGTRNVPYYFCVSTDALASTTELYGAHVAYGIDKIRVIETIKTGGDDGDIQTRICRDEIRIDTKSEALMSFDFLPNSSDYVIIHIPSGVYVVEIDDRGWQNVQMIYGHTAEAVLVDGGRIFIKEADVFFELFTDLLEV